MYVDLPKGQKKIVRMLIDTYFPYVKELLPIADQCREMGFTEEMTRLLVCFKLVGFRGKLYSGVQDGTLNGNHRGKPATGWDIQTMY